MGHYLLKTQALFGRRAGSYNVYTVITVDKFGQSLTDFKLVQYVMKY